MLADDFTASTFLWSHETAPSDVKFEYVLGQLQINLPPARSMAFHAFDFYDLTDGQFSVLAVGDPTLGVTADLTISGEVAGTSASFHRDGGTLSFTRTVGGVTSVLGSIAYSQFLHRYLRFRESGAQLFFESSSDGAGYQVLATSDTAGLGFVLVELVVNNMTTSSYVETVDDANGGTPSGSACPISQLADTFDSGSLLKFAHQLVQGGGTVAPEAGAVRLTLGAAGGGGAALISSTVYDARSAGFELEVKQMVDTTSQLEVFVLILLSDSLAVEFYEQQGELRFEVGTSTGDATPISAVPYDPVAMRWLRFRTGPDTISWEVSPDGTTWMEMANVAGKSGLDRVRVYTAAISLAATTSSALIDNARVP